MGANADLIARIRKILAKTEEAGCTAEEAEAAFAMASGLMARHNIDMAKVEQASGLDGQGWADEVAFEAASWSGVIDRAASLGVEVFFVAALRETRDRPDGRETRAVRFFGSPANVETARFIFTSLLAAIDRLWKDYRRLHGAKPSGRLTFSTGVIFGFAAKLRAERRRMVKDSDKEDGAGSTSLALEAIGEKIQAAFGDAYPGAVAVPTPRLTRDFSIELIDAGMKAGLDLNLSRPVGSDRGPRALTRK